MGLVFWDSGRTYGGKNTLRAIVNCTWRTRGTSVAILGGTLVRCAPSLPYVVRFFYKKNYCTSSRDPIMSCESAKKKPYRMNHFIISIYDLYPILLQQGMKLKAPRY